MDQPKTKTKPKKYEIEVTNSFDLILGKMAKEKGISKEEVVSKALASYAYLQKELMKNKGSSLVIREGGVVLQRIKLP